MAAFVLENTVLPSSELARTHSEPRKRLSPFSIQIKALDIIFDIVIISFIVVVRVFLASTCRVVISVQAVVVVVLRETMPL